MQNKRAKKKTNRLFVSFSLLSSVCTFVRAYAFASGKKSSIFVLFALQGIQMVAVVVTTTTTKGDDDDKKREKEKRALMYTDEIK
jgi:uncharacterized membrane protein